MPKLTLHVVLPQSAHHYLVALPASQRGVSDTRAMKRNLFERSNLYQWLESTSTSYTVHDLWFDVEDDYRLTVEMDVPDPRPATYLKSTWG